MGSKCQHQQYTLHFSSDSCLASTCWLLLVFWYSLVQDVEGVLHLYQSICKEEKKSEYVHHCEPFSGIILYEKHILSCCPYIFLQVPQDWMLLVGVLSMVGVFVVVMIGVTIFDDYRARKVEDEETPNGKNVRDTYTPVYQGFIQDLESLLALVKIDIQRKYGDVECAQQSRPHSPTGEIAGVNGQNSTGMYVREVSLAQVSCILVYVYVAPPTPVGVWSMAFGLRQRIEYYHTGFRVVCVWGGGGGGGGTQTFYMMWSSCFSKLCLEAFWWYF